MVQVGCRVSVWTRLGVQLLSRLGSGAGRCIAGVGVQDAGIFPTLTKLTRFIIVQYDIFVLK